MRFSRRSRRLKRSLKKTKKRLKKLLLFATLAFLAYIFIGGKTGLYQQMLLRKEKRGLIERISLLQKEQVQLQTKVSLLKEDPDYIEKIAREVYKMAKPGERIYLMVPITTEE